MALNKTKTDPELGRKVQQYLIEKGVETPMVDINLTNEKKVKKIEKSMKEIMETLGLDLTDDSLIKTPHRVANMYVNEIFWGLDYNNFPKMMKIDNKMNYDEMVIEKDITLFSDCEHHIRPIRGAVHIGYIPDKKIPGLSKINRIVEFFCRRPQVQERIGEQIYYALSYLLETENIAVVIEAEHFCVKQRGVEDENSSTITSKLGGCFREPSARMEFFKLIKS